MPKAISWRKLVQNFKKLGFEGPYSGGKHLFMRITKCDLCKKRIKGEPITAGVGFFPKAELCEKCGFPILKFLKKYKFIEPKRAKK